MRSLRIMGVRARGGNGGLESGLLSDVNLGIKVIPTPEVLNAITRQAQPDGSDLDR
jgi:hypothetical protein